MEVNYNILNKIMDKIMDKTIDKLYFCMYIDLSFEMNPKSPDFGQPEVIVDEPQFFYAESREDAYLYAVRTFKKNSKGLISYIYHSMRPTTLRTIFDNDKDKMEKVLNIFNEMRFDNRWEKMDEVYPYIEKFVKINIDHISLYGKDELIYKVSDYMGNEEEEKTE